MFFAFSCENKYEITHLGHIGISIQSPLLVLQRQSVNTLRHKDIPEGALIWISDLTRGMDERTFLIGKDGQVLWW